MCAEVDKSALRLLPLPPSLSPQAIFIIRDRGAGVYSFQSHVNGGYCLGSDENCVIGKVCKSDGVQLHVMCCTCHWDHRKWPQNHKIVET